MTRRAGRIRSRTPIRSPREGAGQALANRVNQLLESRRSGKIHATLLVGGDGLIQVERQKVLGPGCINSRSSFNMDWCHLTAPPKGSMWEARVRNSMGVVTAFLLKRKVATMRRICMSLGIKAARSSSFELKLK